MRLFARIRQLNAIVTVAIFVLFCIHAVVNTLLLADIITMPVNKVITWAMAVLVCVHVVVGIVVTVETFRAQREAGASYPGLNKRFWAVRISGVAIVAFIVIHVLLLGPQPAGSPFLHPFHGAELAVSLLLVASLAVHVFCNAVPLMVSLGVCSDRGRAIDFCIVAGVILVISAVGFVLYYLRWMVM